jgi:hypothetical protein
VRAILNVTTSSRALLAADTEGNGARENNTDELGGILRGCTEIAAAINESERRTFHLLQAGLLPAQKEGARWVTTRARLKRHYNGESAETPKRQAAAASPEITSP